MNIFSINSQSFNVLFYLMLTALNVGAMKTVPTIVEYYF
jgi:hypothetical protein